MALTDEQKIFLRQTAKSYAEAGYTIIKLNGKIPAIKNWPSAEYVWPDEVDTWANGWSGNFGVVLGKKDLVIDIDPRSFKPGDKPHVRLIKDIGITNIMDVAPIVKTGSGGLHIYFRLPDGVSVREINKEYPGIEFKSAGRQVVGASCLHPDTEKVYTFVSTVPLTKTPIAPESLVQLIRARKKTEKTAESKKDKKYTDDLDTINRYIDFLLTAPIAIEGDRGDATTYQTACKGRDFGLSPDKTYELLSLHYNPRCVPSWSEHHLQDKVKNAYAYAVGDTGNARPETQFDPIVQPSSQGRVILYDRGRNGLLKTLNNVFNFLVDPRELITGTLAYDEFNAKVKIVGELPWVDKEELPRNWRDQDSVHLRLWLSKIKHFDVQIMLIEQAVLMAARTKIVHPIRDYLNSLTWDGEKRLDSWLVKLAGADDTKFIHSASRKMLIQAVCRVFEPGCKADYIVVLEGKQGIGKSRLIEILGGEWYADLVIDPHSRDTVDAMMGKWFIEFAEMEVTRRADAQALKAFITRRVDTVRLAYGRNSVDLPRQCVFIGSINPDASCEYLTDTTGNRRFWPILIKYLDQKRLIEWRDQLFAEAVHAYKKGEDTYITDESVNTLAADEQKKRQVSDPWIVPIAEWINDKKGIPHNTKNVFIFALKGNESQLGAIQNRRIATCLNELGFINHVEWDKELNRSVRVYRYKGSGTVDE